MHPVLLHIGHLLIPTFGLLALAGILLALFLSLGSAARCGLPPDAVWDAGVFAVMAAFVASRALLLATNFASFRAAPLLLLTVPSLTAGGLLLTAVAVVVFLRLHALPLLRVMDAWAVPGLVMWAALALGHLAEGSDPGMPVARFGLRSSLAGYREQPVALYAAAIALLLAAVFAARTRRLHTAGQVAAAAMLLAGVAQFALSFLRLPYLYTEATPWALLDPIEWVALGMMVFGGMVAVASEWRAPSAAARQTTLAWHGQAAGES